MSILDLYKNMFGIKESLSLTPYQHPYFIVNTSTYRGEDNE